MFNFDEWAINFEAMKQEEGIFKSGFIPQDDLPDEVINLRSSQVEQKPMKKF